MAAAAGALASSTAVTVANARHAAAGEGSPRLLAAGVAVASAIMFLRVAAIVAVLKPGLLVLVAPTLLAATLVAAGFAIIYPFRRRRERSTQRDRSDEEAKQCHGSDLNREQAAADRHRGGDQRCSMVTQSRNPV